MTNSTNPFELPEKEHAGTVPFGRESVIREIFDRLNSDPVQGAGSFSLVGPKYIGKTTILRNLSMPAIYTAFLGPTADLQVVYIDCAQLPTTRREAFRFLGKNLIDTAKTQWGIVFNEQPADEYIGLLRNTSELTELIAAFEGLLKELSSRHNRILAFALDNFEKLLSLLSESDIQFMRDVFSNTRHALVVATPRSIREHSPKTFPSKFYEIFKKHHLRPFSRDQAYEYLTETSRNSVRQFFHSEKEFILRRAGTHPHFLRIYGAEVWMKKLNLPDDQPIEDYSRIDQKARSRLAENFLDIWSALDKDLQTILYQFATEHIQENDIVRSLQRLEDEHAVVLRKEGHFEIMGEAFKDFVIAQTEVIDYLLKTDFYRAGLRALSQIQDEKYLDTDPIFYYQKAFQQFTAAVPDCDSANAMIRDSFERVLDVIVKRSESQSGAVFAGAGFKEKIKFIEEAFEIEDRIAKLISEFWNISNSDGPHPGNPANSFNTQLRFYLLSGLIQYFVNARPKNSSSHHIS